MSQAMYEATLFRGEWTPKTHGKLSNLVRYALYQMCKHTHGLYVNRVALEAVPEGVIVQVLVTDREDGSLDNDCPEDIAELIQYTLIAYLHPRYETQVEVECVKLLLDWSDCECV
jgi:hypothetical protein